MAFKFNPAKQPSATATPPLTTVPGAKQMTQSDALNIQKKDPSLWDNIMKVLSVPVGLAATAVEDTIYTGAEAAMGVPMDKWTIKNTPDKLGGILTGTRQYSFIDIMAFVFKLIFIKRDNFI
jgi:hypothetical protein